MWHAFTPRNSCKLTSTHSDMHARTHITNCVSVFWLHLYQQTQKTCCTLTKLHRLSTRGTQYVRHTHTHTRDSQTRHHTVTMHDADAIIEWGMMHRGSLAHVHTWSHSACWTLTFNLFLSLFCTDRTFTFTNSTVGKTLAYSINKAKTENTKMT